VLRRCEDFVDVARQPVFIVGQGCVGLFEIAKFGDLARGSRNIQESPVLGGSGAVLVCCEHLICKSVRQGFDEVAALRGDRGFDDLASVASDCRN
jgi:hypothetical protein